MAMWPSVDAHSAYHEREAFIAVARHEQYIVGIEVAARHVIGPQDAQQADHLHQQPGHTPTALGHVLEEACDTTSIRLESEALRVL